MAKAFCPKSTSVRGKPKNPKFPLAIPTLSMFLVSSCHTRLPASKVMSATMVQIRYARRGRESKLKVIWEVKMLLKLTTGPSI
jgi:hypothetical protein